MPTRALLLAQAPFAVGRIFEHPPPAQGACGSFDAPVPALFFHHTPPRHDTAAVTAAMQARGAFSTLPQTRSPRQNASTAWTDSITSSARAVVAGYPRDASDPDPHPHDPPRALYEMIHLCKSSSTLQPSRHTCRVQHKRRAASPYPQSPPLLAREYVQAQSMPPRPFMLARAPFSVAALLLNPIPTAQHKV